MTSFASHPCFAREGSGIFTIGAACVRLSDILAAFPEAHDARLALGDPFNADRASKALSILSGLHPKVQAKILAADEGKRRNRRSSGYERP